MVGGRVVLVRGGTESAPSFKDNPGSELVMSSSSNSSLWSCFLILARVEVSPYVTTITLPLSFVSFFLFAPAVVAGGAGGPRGEEQCRKNVE